MRDRLVELNVNLVRFRKAVEILLSHNLTTPQNWQSCFSEISISTALLYADYVVIVAAIRNAEPMTSGEFIGENVQTDHVHELRLREELKQRLEAPSSWPGFAPRNPFSKVTGLLTLNDYASSLILHLPEIYEETFRVEAYLRDFLTAGSGDALTRLLVTLQHLGKNHALFLLQPLEWAGDEDCWDGEVLTTVN